MDFRAPERRELNALLAVTVAVLGLALTFFIYTRPERNYFGYEHDFVNVVAGSHCVLDRCDPYDSPTLEREFRRMGGYTAPTHFLPEWPVYPPATLLLLLPLALLHWPLLSAVWMLLCFGFFSSAWVVLILKFEAYRDLLSFVPFAVMLDDKSTGWAIQLGQPCLIATSSIALAMVLLVSEAAPWWGAAFLALSLCLKPQLAFLCGLYFLLRKQSWRQALAAYGFAAAALVAGTLLFYFRLSSFSFLSHLAANLKLTFQPGRDSDPSILNAGSDGFLNLQATVARFTHSPHVWNGVTYAAIAALAALLVFSCYRNRNFVSRPYTILAVLLMIELIMSYHRAYDHLLILAAIPALYEVEKIRLTGYLVLTGVFCVYHFGQLHGAWTRGWGPLPIGAPLEILFALLCIASLWWSRPQKKVGYGL